MHIVEFAFVAYPATNRERARAFYEEVLGLSPGLSIENGDEFWVEYEVGPHTLGIGNEPFLKPCGDGPQLVLEVGDFDEAVAHLRKHGVPFAVDPFDLPTCRAAVVLDPDGNALGIHQRMKNSTTLNQQKSSS